MRRTLVKTLVNFTVFTLIVPVPVLRAANVWRIIGWSEYGINNVERDYSLFAIYPPSAIIRAQVIDPTGALYRGATGVTVTYAPLADPSHSINSTSIGRTNYPGAAPLQGSMTFDGSYNRFSALGIPITPYDDSLNINSYPVFKLTALDASGNVLATTRITIPVSNEVECRGCHASGANPDAQPSAGAHVGQSAPVALIVRWPAQIIRHPGSKPRLSPARRYRV